MKEARHFLYDFIYMKCAEEADAQTEKVDDGCQSWREG